MAPASTPRPSGAFSTSRAPPNNHGNAKWRLCQQTLTPTRRPAAPDTGSTSRRFASVPTRLHHHGIEDSSGASARAATAVARVHAENLTSDAFAACTTGAGLRPSADKCSTSSPLDDQQHGNGARPTHDHAAKLARRILTFMQIRDDDATPNSSPAGGPHFNGS